MSIELPVGQWMESIVNWALRNLTGLFDAVTLVIGSIVNSFEAALLAVPVWAMVIAITLIAVWRVSWRFGVFTLLALGLVLGIDMWTQTMATLALILGATFMSLVVGLPAGVLAAKSDIAEAIIRPILDVMQTLPSFVYLIPAAMFFGLGKVPGTIATVIFAVPPAVRLTNLGIRGVDRELLEAGIAFGCTRRQLLFKVELPAALPSIMTGVNQTIMLALSMVVIAAMIGAGGLGNEVLAGIQRLDIGRGFEGGFAVVVLAIILDRLSQSLAVRSPPENALRRWATMLFGQSRSTDSDRSTP
jgi:glycine betaine/proline transport system permease protein